MSGHAHALPFSLHEVGRPRCYGNRPASPNSSPLQGKRPMTKSTLGPRAPKHERPTRWDILLAILAGWPTTLRLALLLSIVLTAIVSIVALVVIYLGPIGATAMLAGGTGGSYGIKRFLTRRRRRREAASGSGSVEHVAALAAPQVAGFTAVSSRNEITYPLGCIRWPPTCDDANFGGFVVPFRLLSMPYSSCTIANSQLAGMDSGGKGLHSFSSIRSM